MNNKQIKQLALSSYTNNKLDEKKVNKIVKYLSQANLKKYIKYLKSLENSKIVKVFTANKNNKIIEQEIKKIFKDKRIIIEQDKSLIAGIKIVNNDLVYEANVKNNLNNLVNFISN